MYGGVVVQLAHLTAGKPKTEIPNLPVSRKWINLMKVATIFLGPGRELAQKVPKMVTLKWHSIFFSRGPTLAN